MSIVHRSLWRAANAAFPGANVGALARRLKMFLSGLRHHKHLAPLVSADDDALVSRLVRERPETLGLLMWPYISAFWPAPMRLRRTLEHSEIVAALEKPIEFSIHEHIEVANLSDVHDGVWLMVDQPVWFMREGLLTINLMVDDLRAFSIAFSLMYDERGDVCAVIGGIQGRNTEGALSLYRDLTKSFFGLRPRDLLLEALKIFLRSLNIRRLLAVSDAARHHRHPYFDKKGEDFTLNYDEIWEDRNGKRIDEEFYLLDLSADHRDLSTIKQKKRSLYRKRFAFLDELRERIGDSLDKIKPRISGKFR